MIDMTTAATSSDREPELETAKLRHFIDIGLGDRNGSKRRTTNTRAPVGVFASEGSPSPTKAATSLSCKARHQATTTASASSEWHVLVGNSRSVNSITRSSVIRMGKRQL